MIALLLPVPGVPSPNAPTGLGAPAGIVAPKHTSKDLIKALNRNTTTRSTHAHVAASASANSTVADWHGEPAPALSLPEQHTRVEEACSSSGTVSKLMNRLRVEQNEFQLLRAEVNRLASENAELAAVPTLARPPRVGPSTILQHGVWYHRRWGLKAIDDGKAEAPGTGSKREGSGRKPAGVSELALLAADDLDKGEEPFGTADWWEYAGVVLGTLLLASFAACLVALHSISMLDLDVLEVRGSDEERARAAKLRPLIEQPRRLLVTLLLLYVGASEALPVFLDKLMPDWLAIAASAAAVLTLGEVLPQALCTSPDKLALAAFFSPLVRALMLLLAPVAWPIAWALDKVLGPRQQRPSEMQATMQLDSDASTRPRGSERADASKAAAPAAAPATAPPDPREKCAVDAMTPWAEAHTLCSSTYLDDEVLADILASGCSRMPVWPAGSPDSVCGILVVKRLLALGPEPGSLLNPQLARQLLHPPVVVSENTPLLTLFAAFQSARAHLAVILPTERAARRARRLLASGNPWPTELKISGTVSVEDVFEELVHEGVDDEEASLRAATQLANDAEVRARLRRLRSLGTKRLHEALLSANHADDATHMAAVRTGSGAPVTPQRTPLGRGLRKAAAAKVSLC